MTPRTDKLLDHMDKKKFSDSTGCLALIAHAQNLEEELIECAHQLEDSAAREAAFAVHHCESEGCAHEMGYTKRAAEWADKFHAMKEAIKELLSAMEMQEGREMETLLISQPTARKIWDDAKAKAHAALSDD